MYYTLRSKGKVYDHINNAFFNADDNYQIYKNLFVKFPSHIQDIFKNNHIWMQCNMGNSFYNIFTKVFSFEVEYFDKDDPYWIIQNAVNNQYTVVKEEGLLEISLRKIIPSIFNEAITIVY